MKTFPGERILWEDCISAQSVSLPEQYVEQRGKRKITYLCFSKGGGGFPPNLPTRDELRGAMADIWSDIAYIERGRRFSSICVTFETEEEAQDQARLK